MPNLSTAVSIFPFKVDSVQGTDSAPIFGDIIQSERLSEIKLPLAALPVNVVGISDLSAQKYHLHMP